MTELGTGIEEKRRLCCEYMERESPPIYWKKENQFIIAHNDLFTCYGHVDPPMENKMNALIYFLDKCCDPCKRRILYELIEHQELQFGRFTAFETIAELIVELDSLRKKQMNDALVKVGFVSALESGYAT